MPTQQKPTWWKEMSVYQIWPRSFADGNDDGIGDLHGVLQKLDYVKALGVDAIWFSPLFTSPQCDYGYDIADYRDIAPEYGDLTLFKKVLDEAHARGLKIFMDLVVNHTSDHHKWFLESKKSKDNPYSDYYIWRAGKGKKPPNNWLSMFEGGAWEYVPERDEYYLHIFAKGQPDLNMANPKVREEVKDIMRFWLDMGVDGFREDVITYIAKREGLPNGFPLPVATGFPHWTNQPEVKDYLREFQQEVLSKYGAFTVGESPMMTPEVAKEYITDGAGNLLNMMFHFQHMEADCVINDWIGLPFRLKKLKKVFTAWQLAMKDEGWNALYIENHDHPRIIDRYGSRAYRAESAKMLAAMYILQSGTPFIYQGQEIGMTNIALNSIDEFKDVVTFNNRELAKKLHLDGNFFLKLANRRSRENARTPMQWSGESNGGFSQAKPWFNVNPNYEEINVAAAEADPNSILHFYRALLKFRKDHPALVIYGGYEEHCKASKSLYVYTREGGGEKLLVICSFKDKPVKFTAPEGFDLSKADLLFCNYDASNAFAGLRPYECRVYLWRDQE